VFAHNDVIGQMEDLLDRERAAVLDGDLEVLRRLVARKERLTSALSKAAPEAAAVARLRDKADRNRVLLEAAGRGIRAAGARLQALRRGPGDFQTYDRSGQRTGMTATGGAHGTRA